MGRRRIRISAVSAHKPIHHEFEHTGRVIPMHGTNNHDAVGRDPARVDFVHPILRLSEVMIRITTAGPVTQWHGGRDASFARVNYAAVFRRQVAQIEYIDLKTEFGVHYRLRRFRDSKAFRYFAGTGFVRARGTADEQDAGRRLWILILLLSGENLLTRFEPFQRKLVLRIGKFRACFTRPRTLSMVLIGLPGDLRQPIDAFRLSRECGIVKALFPPTLKFFTTQPGRALTSADLGVKETHC